MRSIVLAWAVAGAVGLLALPVQATEPAPTAECDRLAASPNDTSIPPGTGVEFVDIDAAAAITACEASVKALPNDPRQLHQLGRAYDAADQYDRAIASYTAAADKGYALAFAALGALHELGLGVPEDPAKAAALYQQAADGGMVEALVNLGLLYEDGRGVAQDYAKAASLYRQAADKGSTYANGMLGWLAENGFGVAKDEVEALRLYRIAADGGAAFAQHNVGVMLTVGRGGLTPDDAEAFKYYSLAAEQHWAPSYNSLGWVYNNGKGVAKDLAQSEHFFRLAIAEGDADVRGDASNNLAWLFATQNIHLDEAEGIARQAIAADPTVATRHDTLAWILHLMGRDAEALPVIEEALRLESDNAEFIAHAAAIRAKLKT